MKDYADIDRVIELGSAEQPAQSSAPNVATRTVHDTAEPAAEPLLKRDDAGSYAIFPQDGKDTTATNETEQNLQQIFGADNLLPPVIYQDEVLFWDAYNGKQHLQFSHPLEISEAPSHVNIYFLILSSHRCPARSSCQRPWSAGD